MARFCPIASGSSGNCIYVSYGNTSVVIDAGIPFKQIESGVSMCGGDVSKISAIVITHSHTDHISGIKALINKTHAPIYATKDTVLELIHKNLLPKDSVLIDSDVDSAVIGDIKVSRFKTSHDAPGSCGYRVNTPSGDCAVCTDLGIVTDKVRTALSGCKLVLFESNHDIDMLRRGPYPAHLKIRILSDLGHLSNNTSAAEIPFLINSGVKQIILGHLSQKNNTPDLAISAARISAESAGAKVDADFLLSAAKPGFSGVSVF